MTIYDYILRIESVDENLWGRQSLWDGAILSRYGKAMPKINKRWAKENKDKKKLSELLNKDEYLGLICLVGHHLKAINDGEIDYFMLGDTPKKRILGFLYRLRDFNIDI